MKRINSPYWEEKGRGGGEEEERRRRGEGEEKERRRRREARVRREETFIQYICQLPMHHSVQCTLYTVNYTQPPLLPLLVLVAYL